MKKTTTKMMSGGKATAKKMSGGKTYKMGGKTTPKKKMQPGGTAGRDMAATQALSGKCTKDNPNCIPGTKGGKSGKQSLKSKVLNIFSPKVKRLT